MGCLKCLVRQGFNLFYRAEYQLLLCLGRGKKVIIKPFLSTLCSYANVRHKVIPHWKKSSVRFSRAAPNSQESVSEVGAPIYMWNPWWMNEAKISTTLPWDWKLRKTAFWREVALTKFCWHVRDSKGNSLWGERERLLWLTWAQWDFLKTKAAVALVYDSRKSDRELQTWSLNSNH